MAGAESERKTCQKLGRKGIQGQFRQSLAGLDEESGFCSTCEKCEDSRQGMVGSTGGLTDSSI